MQNAFAKVADQWNCYVHVCVCVCVRILRRVQCAQPSQGEYLCQQPSSGRGEASVCVCVCVCTVLVPCVPSVCVCLCVCRVLINMQLLLACQCTGPARLELPPATHCSPPPVAAAPVRRVAAFSSTLHSTWLRLCVVDASVSVKDSRMCWLQIGMACLPPPSTHNTASLPLGLLVSASTICSGFYVRPTHAAVSCRGVTVFPPFPSVPASRQLWLSFSL